MNHKNTISDDTQKPKFDRKIKNILYTHSLAIPAFLTAELTAFTAVWMLFKSCVKSPVAVGTLFCSAKTNLVKVMQLESNAGPVDVILLHNSKLLP
jgi:hypothetical protein